ncbi:hypothetical protein ACFOWE_03260 [Planomonospora corallina]|uniref:Lantibiotic n=1 Tax=Planomonospora corallina TaxID=1806052 RepID=A0ABV8I2L3_9ACTN
MSGNDLFDLDPRVSSSGEGTAEPAGTPTITVTISVRACTKVTRIRTCTCKGCTTARTCIRCK